VKLAGCILTAWLLLNAQAFGETAALSFQTSKPAVDGASFPGQLTVPIAMDVSLTAVEYLLPLEAGEEAGSIHAYANDRVHRDIQALSLENMTTSDSHIYDSLLATERAPRALAGNVVHVAGEIDLNGRRYAELLVFPVTVDSAGQSWFNRSVVIQVGERTVNQPDLIPRNNLLDIYTTSGKQRSQTTSSAGPEYVIITSAWLAGAFQPLIDYKNETGYVAELALIEDILAAQTGRDDAEKLREYLKDFYAAGGCYVLLAGDETVVPIRYTYHYDVSITPSLFGQQICDLYFADLTGGWDLDNDGVWGERYHDRPDLVPELRVGRLPVSSVDEATNYINKLIRYETKPGDADPGYLERAFFFSSDQMRDYSNGGQHGRIATAYPDWFDIDTITGVEATNGNDLTPSNTSPAELKPSFDHGYGIVNVIAHGRSDGFVVKSSGYNEWPKSYLLTQAQFASHGCFDSLMAAAKPGFFYSLACDNGGFDMDEPPFNYVNPLMVHKLIGSAGGAVGFVAYSRWGWIGSSYLLQETFFDSLFAHPELPAVEAMYASKAKYYYLRDLVYGQNFYGDPTLKVFSRIPDRLSIDATADDDGMNVRVTANGRPADACYIILAAGGISLAEYQTGSDGRVFIDHLFDQATEYKITAVRTGATVSQARYIHGVVTSTDDQDGVLPRGFELHQNYPNPFNPSTVISFDLANGAAATLVVHNVLGQTVTTLIDTYLDAGGHTIEWDGCDRIGSQAASGIYFYRLSTIEQTSVKKMILLR
jgi:hypothetical protein